EETLTSILSDYGVRIHSIDYEKRESTGELIYNFNISTRKKTSLKEIFLKLSSLESIKNIRIGNYRIDGSS
ncbi:MAG: hypothetical protein L0922_03685, partial [Candidatus Mariimomonas ferrooxydans]